MGGGGGVMQAPPGRRRVQQDGDCLWSEKQIRKVFKLNPSERTGTESVFGT